MIPILMKNNNGSDNNNNKDDDLDAVNDNVDSIQIIQMCVCCIINSGEVIIKWPDRQSQLKKKITVTIIPRHNSWIKKSKTNRERI